MYKLLFFNAYAFLQRTEGFSLFSPSDQNVGSELNVENEATHANCDTTEHESNGFDCIFNGKI